MGRNVSSLTLRHHRRGATFLATLLAVVALVAGPTVPGSAGASVARTGSRLRVVERDFSIRSRVKSVAAGTVTLHVENRGPSTHEFNIDRTVLAANALPLGPDGLTVSEDSSALHRVTAVDDVRLHEQVDITLNLKPGHYVLYCNLEGHYLGGMHYDLNVKAAQ